ncbi:hypothetical protein [Caproicibacterium sp. BJN0003]|uniref:hypothetical protein n=1 Tax=Caproicibacterium sp. BJN0003 TaxID=2994078 RepID=UPI00224F0384|nr:hypothetical protein [Caproicibacterium sp. BJN0003]UZT81951.1 hypothetical protein OP489_10825 [Caproicibacterium sp. BJN0003]
MSIKLNADQNPMMKHIISWILSFFLSLFLFLLSCAALFQATVLSPSFLKEQIVKSNAAFYLTQDLKETFVSYGISSDFDEDFFNSALDETQVQSDLFGEVDQLYDPSAPQIDFDSFQNQMYQKLLKNVKERNIEVTDTVDGALQYLAQVCRESYQETVRIPLFSYASGTLQFLKKPILIATIGLAALALFVIVFLYFLRHKRSFCRYCIYACSGAALTLFVPWAVVVFSGKIEKIGITQKALYALMTTYTHQVLFFLLLMIGILVLMAVIFSIVYLVLEKKDCQRMFNNPSVKVF